MQLFRFPRRLPAAAILRELKGRRCGALPSGRLQFAKRTFLFEFVWCAAGCARRLRPSFQSFV